MTFFNNLWQYFKSKNHQAVQVENYLKSRNIVWCHDHIAFRTFSGECGADSLAEPFINLFGYTKRDIYQFPDKNLSAFWLEPPHKETDRVDEVLPKIFISEYLVEKAPLETKQIIDKYLSTLEYDPLVPCDEKTLYAFLTTGRPWQRPTYEDYQTLLFTSEYAAWTLVFGYRPNHFTVNVNASGMTLTEMNSVLITDLKLLMNEFGGMIKGSPEVYLEQSSTMAEQVPVMFQERLIELPFGFVEFAYRYALPNKKNDLIYTSYYNGFRASNADRIFESTKPL
jgi:hypothetical protein